MNLLLHGIEDFKIVKEDTLRNPAFFEGDKLAQFDCVIANPPFSLENWGEEAWLSDRYGRNSLGGVPPKKNADWAWVQHMYQSMNDESGRVAVVLPQGALTRGGADGKIRKAFLEKDLIECVIGMAPKLFYGTTLAPCIIILRAKKNESQSKKILMINAENFYKRGRNQNVLENAHLTKILEVYKNFASIEGIAQIVSIFDIKSNNFSLNISQYVASVRSERQVTLMEYSNHLEVVSSRAQESRANLSNEFRKWGLDVTK
jgi:type I restriction enzyme M protein